MYHVIPGVAPKARLDAGSGVGSLNRGEISHKVNREVALLAGTPAVYDRLIQVFARY